MKLQITAEQIELHIGAELHIGFWSKENHTLYSDFPQNINSRAHDNWMQIQKDSNKIIQNTMQIDYNLP